MSRWPWWVQVLAVYAATRVWSTAVLLLAARGQNESAWGPARPDYATFVGLFWDGSWYREIAEEGYPDGLPRDAAGAPTQSAWAFYPLFPLVARGLMAVTGGPWSVVAPTLALVAGAGAALVLDRLVQGHLDRRPRGGAPGSRRLALGTVLLLGLYPAAPVLQAAYTESLSLLLAASFVALLVRRHYLLAAPVVVALGFTRAVALPMALVVGVHLLRRYLAHRDGRESLPRRDAVAIGAVGATAAAAGVAWPVVVGAATGVPDAYVQIQAAWRGSFSSAPVQPWFEMATFLLGRAGILVLVLAVITAFALALTREAGAAGPEVQAWGVAYLLYLLAVAFPQSSVIRFLMLAFPLLLALAGLARSRWALVLLAAAFAAAQAGWVIWLWQVTAPTPWPP